LLARDEPTGAWIAIALHSTRLGPAVGGTRMRAYPDPAAALADAHRLAAAMTLKFAVPGLPWGGGKGVIAVPPGLPAEERPGLLRRYGSAVAALGGRYRTGPDAGVSSEDMNLIAETGAPWVFGRTPEAGGAGPSGPATAIGVMAAIGVACEEAFGTQDVSGLRVLVQGAGSVGATLIGLLNRARAEVLVSEIDPAALAHALDAGALAVAPEAVGSTRCDIYAPCAFGGVVNAATLPLLACRAIVGGANNQLEDADLAVALAGRGILYAPDFVANAGGAMAGVRMEADGWTRARAEREVVDRIRAGLRRVFTIARERGVDPDAAARLLARERLAAG
jgi:glutamate dehydrogenase/leucine dehydrogenase